MRKPAEAIIFDMDGCLYPFDRGSGRTFTESQFGLAIAASELAFIQDKLLVNASEAAQISNDLKVRYDQHLSLALEHEHGISREEFFTVTWDLQAAEFIDAQPELPVMLGRLAVPAGLLTAAPKVWADRVLEHLQVRNCFGVNILCGDQDIRKPDARAFQQVADMLGIRPQSIISIGDQEHTDIVPAQSLGMMTVRIGNDATTSADFLASDVSDAIKQLEGAGLL